MSTSRRAARNVISVTEQAAQPAEELSYLAINDSREGQVVEYLCAVSPDGDGAVLAEALVVEAIDLGDLPGLVVSTNQGYPVGVAHLRKH